MKKILTLALALGFAGMASAATMQWAANSVAFDGTKFNKTTGAGSVLTGYLIALDQFSTSYTVDDTFDATKIGALVDTNSSGTSAMGKLNKAWTIDTDNYANGDTFAVLLKYTGASDGKTYWNLSSGLVTLEGFSVDPPTNASNTTASFSYGKGTDGTLTAGGGWVAAAAVPEPGIACMALLGIGMMIKRRRA